MPVKTILFSSQILSVLDPVNFPDDQDAYESILLTLAEKFKGRLTFAWFGALEQPALIETFQLHMTPAVVVFSAKKLSYVILFGTRVINIRYTRVVAPFEEKSLAEYIDRILMGRKDSMSFAGFFYILVL